MLNHVVSMASWNFRLARRWYAALCGAFALQQLVVLLTMASRTEYVRCSYAGLYYYGYQLFAFGAAFLAAGVLSARNLMHNRGRTHAAYLWLTLPQPRCVKLMGQVLTALIMELGILALQAAMYVAFYFPVAAVQRWRMNQYLMQRMPADDLYEQVIHSALMAVYPTTWPSLALLLLILAASAVMLPCIFLHTGWRSAVSAGMTAVGGGICLIMLKERQTSAISLVHTETLCRVAALVALIVLSWLWALHALRQAEPAQ